MLLQSCPLAFDQKQQHVDVCCELHGMINNYCTFISMVITRDENLILQLRSRDKTTVMLWMSPQLPIAKNMWQIRSKTKFMLIVVFDIRGIVHQEFIPAGVPVNF